ncbi:hypothetical protein CVIRNUC_000852 [Coccomyxa viridis]|uniref:BZIP domain-containing protein n=1 Tax=Coccomyxa viridis TaxID=1274662 RepID=A0AAV1HTS0_9CHLO|nr:hypothetical protein CVIRNUC_000852 [Coccomyxa viridis]
MGSIPEASGTELDTFAMSSDLLSQFQRTMAETSPGQMQADLQTILAASMHMAPMGGMPGLHALEQLAPDLAASADAMPATDLLAAPGASQEHDSEQPSGGQAEMQQENGNGEVSSAAGLKRKGTPLTEEERRIRRKEINRESARRIRKRKNNEMESLKQQVGQLTNQVQLLIRFAAHVTRENRELALRLQQAAAQGGRHAQEEMQDPGLVASEALPAYEAQLTAQQYAPVHLPGLPQQ